MIVVLDNIIRACLPQVFRGVFDIERAEAFTFKITRDAELELGEGITQSLVDALSSSLKKRKLGDPVRLVYDRRMPNDMLDIMVKRFRLGGYDNVLPGARYHNSKDFMDFPNLGARSLENRPIGPLMVPRIDRHANIFAAIAERDILLNYPYHSFRYTEQLLSCGGDRPRGTRDPGHALPGGAQLAYRQLADLRRAERQGGVRDRRVARALRRGREHRLGQAPHRGRRARGLRHPGPQGALRS